MIKKLQNRFILTMIAIATVLLGILFFSIPIMESNLATSNASNTLDVILDKPEEILSSKDNPSSFTYSAFYVNHVGTITKYYSMQYNRSQLERIYNEIKQDYYGNENFMLEKSHLYYSYTNTASGTWYAISDSTEDEKYNESLFTTCMIMYAISMIVVSILTIFLSKWIIKPTEYAWNKQKQFIADASHELKTPLTVILTNAELLNKTESPNGSQKKYVTNILTESHQMKTLITHLLDLARIDRGIPKENFVQVDMTSLVTDESLVMEVELYERGHVLEATTDENLYVKGDKSKLQEVIDILLDNAGKYAHEGSQIDIKLSKLGSSHVLLSVSNKGDNLSEQELRNIFTRFYRTDTSRSHNGSYGLGLSIAKEIITQHGGLIWAECSDGLITFKVKLPLLTPHKEQKPDS
ncbi:MAG: HAMP domain-containing histidine kinase [Butyrivibrio sp.]|uniref:sensor histidine kinase n=1 Tax=Butyrivibrio sp. TaxID=28121 RepID=UPI0025EDCB28|nr:HAMP domain-containing sensor histidine kinase [Butyrivibrio sp.]MCR5773241.1 HAMP domain-containing histidine kinase [Butyrivibrio sp.]